MEYIQTKRNTSLVEYFQQVYLSQEDISFKSQINKCIVFSGGLTLAIVAVNLNALKQIESDEIVINLGLVNIGELLSNVISDFYIAADEKNIKLIMNKEEDRDYIVLGDCDKLKQVFINIISNGIKFNNINGTVWVNVGSDINSVIVEIKDNGIGIKKEDLPYVFERMYRGDKSKELSEMYYRVLKPGGRVVCLELSKPNIPILKNIL